MKKKIAKEEDEKSQVSVMLPFLIK